MKKYIFWIFATIATCTSCSYDDTALDPRPESQDGLLAFRTDVDDTRATVLNNATIKDMGLFNIAAYETNRHYFNTSVEYSSSTSQWATTEDYYWNSDKRLIFHAYAPTTLLPSANGQIEELAPSGAIADHALLYDCPSEVGEQVDLLSARKDQTITEVTTLDFEHILSQIAFTVKIADEHNVRLTSVDVTYRGEMVSQGTYNFSSNSWTLNEAATYHDFTSTSIEVNKIHTDSETDAYFVVDDALIILPQQIDIQHLPYLTVSVHYQLLTTGGVVTSTIQTGEAQLSLPVGKSGYEQGYRYLYNLVVNNDTITMGDVSVEEQTTTTAPGNINLSMITDRISKEQYDEAVSTNTPAVSTEDSFTDDSGVYQYYYSTGWRVRELLLSGVRDFVIYGSLGASSEVALGNGKLGYWGGESSPFIMGFDDSGLKDGSKTNLFSIDIRGVTGFPTLRVAHGDGSTTPDATLHSDILDDKAPAIAAGLFKGVDNLREVMLPDEILALGDYSFSECHDLVSIDLGRTAHLEEGALYNCDKLEYVKHGELTRLHANALQGSTKLKQIDLSRAREVNDHAMSGCNELESVDLGALEVVGPHAFSYCTMLNMSNTTAPKLQENVGFYAFFDCNTLGYNSAPINLSRVERVEQFAFGNCYNLTVVESDPYDGNSLVQIDNNAFENCHAMGAFRMPNITTIGAAAFANCTNLQFNDTHNVFSYLHTIGDYAFQNCSSIEKISIPQVRSIGAYAFAGCSKMNFVERNYTNTSLESIGDHAFDSCTALDDYLVFDNVTSLGEFAFSSCTNLRGLSLPALQATATNRLAPECIKWCTSLNSLSMPLIEEAVCEPYTPTGASEPTITTIYQMLHDIPTIENINLHFLKNPIPDNTFQGFASLKTVDFSSTTAVGDRAFAYCSSLESLDLPKVTSCGLAAFEHCSELVSISLPEVTSLGDYVFSNCKKLESLSLPRMTTFKQIYFENCIALKTIKLGALPAYAWGMFDNCPALIDLSMPAITEIGGYAFNYSGGNDMRRIQSLDISGVTKLGNDVFITCESISRLDVSGLEAGGWDDSITSNPYGPSADSFYQFVREPAMAQNCYVKVSATQYAAATGTSAEGYKTTWAGIEWKGVLGPEHEMPALE